MEYSSALFNVSETTIKTPYWSLTGRIMLSSTMILMMTLAVFGNLLVLVVILRTRSMHTRTNMFLGNLAMTDFLCGCIDMPFSLVTVIRGEWIFSENICQMNGFATPFFFVASIHTLMYIAVFKYISIRNPFSQALTTSRVSVMIVAAWVWAALIGYLSIDGLVVSEFQPYTTQCGPHYIRKPNYYGYFAILLVTCYAVPLIIITLCYSGMFYEIRSHGKRLRLHSTTDKAKIYKQQKHIMFTLFLVVIVFIMTWTPWVVYSLYALLCEEEVKAHLANPITFWFGYLNSACNPVIYALRSKSFRNGYKSALTRGPSNLGYQVAGSSVGSYFPRSHHSTESSFVVRNSSSVKSNISHEVQTFRLSTSSIFEEPIIDDKEIEMEELKICIENKEIPKTETTAQKSSSSSSEARSALHQVTHKGQNENLIKKKNPKIIRFEKPETSVPSNEPFDQEIYSQDINEEKMNIFQRKGNPKLNNFKNETTMCHHMSHQSKRLILLMMSVRNKMRFY